MFTDNYIALQHNLFFNTFGGSATNGVSGKYLKGAGGQQVNIYTSMTMTNFNNIGIALSKGRCRNIVTGVASSNGNTYHGVYFGSGSTPANKADYTLESPITSGLNVTSQNVCILNKGDGQYEVRGQYIVENTTSAEINIYEIGVFLPIQSKSSEWYSVLMERTVLTKPITIAPGESKLVTYKLTFNQSVS